MTQKHRQKIAALIGDRAKLRTDGIFSAGCRPVIPVTSVPENERHVWSTPATASVYRMLFSQVAGTLGPLTSSRSELDHLRNSLKLTGTEIVLNISSGVSQHVVDVAKQLPEGLLVCVNSCLATLKLTQHQLLQNCVDNVILVHASWSDLPFLDQVFDSVVCRIDLDETSDVNYLVSEIFRVCRVNGTVAGLTVSSQSSTLGSAAVFEYPGSQSYIGARIGQEFVIRGCDQWQWSEQGHCGYFKAALAG